MLKLSFLSVASCGFKTLYVAISEEPGVRISGKRVLKKIFEEVTGGWRKLRNKEI
jgi:hypothetical protein